MISVFIIAVQIFVAASWLCLSAQAEQKVTKAKEVRQAGGESFEDWEQLRVLGLGTIFSLAYSPDGSRLAIGGTAGAFEIRDTKTWEIELQVNEAPRVNSLSWSPDGCRLVSGALNSTAKIWDAKSGELLQTLPGHGLSVNAVDWSQDGRIATGAASGIVRIWNPETGQLIRSIDAERRGVLSLKWSPDSRRIATAADGKVKVWNADTGDLMFTFRDGLHYATWVSWSPDGTRVVSASDNSNEPTVKIWDAQKGGLIRTLSEHTAQVLSVDWSPDESRIASSSGDMTIRIWNATTGNLVRTINLGQFIYPGVNRVIWSPDSRRLASGVNLVQIWDAESGQMIENFAESIGGTSLRWSPDSSKIASAGHSGWLHISNVETGRVVVRLIGHRAGIIDSVDWSPDGRQLVSGADDYDRTVRIWDAETGNLIRILMDTRGASSVRWSPDSSRIASGSSDLLLRIWDAKTGELMQAISTTAVGGIRWSPDGTKLVSGGWVLMDGFRRGVIEIRQVETGNLLRTILVGTKAEGVCGVSTLDWSPDGSRIAVGRMGCSGWPTLDITIWDAETGKLMRTIETMSSVYSISWSPDSQYIAQAAGDNTVKIWNAETSQLLRTLTGHVGAINAVDWSPDGDKVVGGNRIWGRREEASGSKASPDSSEATIEPLGFKNNKQKLGGSNLDQSKNWLRSFLSFITFKSLRRY